jgi:RNA polymerase sigma-70 factor (ECF subfamily)
MPADLADFRELHDEFRPRILRYIAGMLGEAEAEDVTQEVFARAARALDRFRGESELSTWLYRIATNAALDRLRQLPREVTSPLDEAQEAAPQANVWTGECEPGVEAQVYRSEMNECIRGFIGRLSDDHRTVLLLSEFEGLGNRQIADILELTLETVKIRLHRARQRLKAELSAHCGPEWVEDNEFLPELK